MGTLQYSFSDLYNDAVGLQLYNTSSPDDTQDVVCKRIVNEGYLEFLNAHDWSFLSPEASIELWTTATGTASGKPVKSGTSSTVTSAAAMFYASMIGHNIAFTTSAKTYEITGYTSTTVVTVFGDASGEADGDTMTVTADGTYALPADFGGLIDRLTFVDEISYGSLAMTTPEHIRHLLGMEADASGDPTYAAVQAKTYTTTTGQRWELLVWRVPNTDREMNYRYRVEAAEMTADAEYPLGGPRHASTILAAVLMVMDRQRGIEGNHARTYERLLARSVQMDAEMRSRNLGPIQDQSDGVEYVVRVDDWQYT